MVLPWWGENIYFVPKEKVSLNFKSFTKSHTNCRIIKILDESIFWLWWLKCVNKLMSCTSFIFCYIFQIKCLFQKNLPLYLSSTVPLNWINHLKKRKWVNSCSNSQSSYCQGYLPLFLCHKEEVLVTFTSWGQGC